MFSSNLRGVLVWNMKSSYNRSSSLIRRNSLHSTMLNFQSIKKKVTIGKEIENQDDKWKESPAYETLRHHGISPKYFNELSLYDKMDVLYYLDIQNNKTMDTYLVRNDTDFIKHATVMKDKFKDTRHLSNFFQVCMDNGEAEVVEHILFRSGAPRDFDSVMPYNAVLNGIYKTQNYSFFTKFCEHLASIEFDVDTFAGIFSCLGLFKDKANTLELTEYLLNMMKLQSIEMQELFEKGYFVGNDRSHAKEAIARVDTNLLNFSETIHTIQCNYDNSLVDSLNKNISKLNAETTMAGVMSEEEMMKCFQEQVEMEKNGSILVKSVLTSHQEETSCNAQNLERQKKWQEIWKCQFRTAFRNHVSNLSDKFNTTYFNKGNIYPYLICLEEDEYVNLMCTVMDNIICNHNISPYKSNLKFTLGNTIYEKYIDKYHRDSFNSAENPIFRELMKWYLDQPTEGGAYNPRIKWQTILNDARALKYVQHSKSSFVRSLKLQIGRPMLNLLITSPTVDVNEGGVIITKLVFEQDLENPLKLEINPALKEYFQFVKIPEYIQLSCDAVPMLCPPLPWLSSEYGGYIIKRLYMLRSGASYKQMILTEACEDNIEPIRDGLSYLGSVPWQINTEILDLMLLIFNNGGMPETGIPEYDDSFNKSNECLDSFTTHEMCEERMKNQYQWSECLRKLSVANHMRNRVLWFPYCVDFRGRAYPLPHILTHYASDVFRSLLIFAKGKRLGSDGLSWLKIHTINLSGLQKAESLHGRLNYCENNLDLIFDSADNPLNGKQWWKNGSTPWQTLAACKELTKALRSECPEDFVSYIPVQQDGSSNGLQHYSALARDSMGASAVNLTQSHYPQDVYMNVLSRVKQTVEKQLSHPSPAVRDLAQKLQPLLKRKTIKHTVMSSVYGVTSGGAFQIIEKQLKETSLTESECLYASQQLTTVTLGVLKHMFKSAKEIQHWLSEYAYFICKYCNEDVCWYSPLGLPIVHPYTSESDNNSNFKNKPNPMKQKNAFPPNYIHSLDATHMFLTALYSAEQRITFAAVHDCFWTHASDVDLLNKINREQFIKLYKLPLLENLDTFFSINFPEPPGMNSSTGLKLPRKGNFNIEEVKHSQYFFS